MGDRSTLTMTVKAQDSGLLDSALVAFEEYAHPMDTTREDHEVNTSDYELSLGTIEELAASLDEMIEDGHELAYELIQDGVYGDAGWLFMHVPGVGKFTQADYAGEVGMVVSADKLDAIVDNAVLFGASVEDAVNQLTHRAIRKGFEDYLG